VSEPRKKREGKRLPGTRRTLEEEGRKSQGKKSRKIRGEKRITVPPRGMGMKIKEACPPTNQENLNLSKCKKKKRENREANEGVS